MAKIIYEVKQNQNSYSAAFGKWYAQIKNLETLNTRKLANRFFCLNTFKYGDKIINNQCNFIIFAIGFNKS